MDYGPGEHAVTRHSGECHTPLQAAPIRCKTKQYVTLLLIKALHTSKKKIEMNILGIDEAGRGPVCGPMMICGYMIEADKIEKLKKTGVRDSKMLTDKRRRGLVPRLKKLASDYVVFRVSSEQIDLLRTETNLNRIEIAKMQEIIRLLRPDKVVIDAPEVNTKKFSQKITAGMQNDVRSTSIRQNGFYLVSENFADKKYPEVAAASVIAKVERDKEIERLHREYGFFGSGYPSDERTISFLKDWIKVNKEFPPFVRKSWMTALAIKKEHEQKKLMEFAM